MSYFDSDIDPDELCADGCDWQLTEIECGCGDDRCVVLCAVCGTEDRACED